MKSKEKLGRNEKQEEQESTKASLQLFAVTETASGN